MRKMRNLRRCALMRIFCALRFLRKGDSCIFSKIIDSRYSNRRIRIRDTLRVFLIYFFIIITTI